MAHKKDFLLEIGTEEMPSAPLSNAVVQLGKLVDEGLDELGLSHGEVRIISTPRRLAALVADVACATEERNESRRGPAARIAFDAEGNPTKAALGFARKQGVSPDQLQKHVDADGNEYVFAEIHEESHPAEPLLTQLSERIISHLEWPNYRSQRWGSEHVSFVRPVRWICALLGSEVIELTYGDVTSSNTTRGHRVLGAGEHVVAEPKLYEDVLRSACVLGEKERAEVIRKGIAQIETERGGAHVDTPRATFQEVVNLCEWPSVIVGKFDEEFLAVPHEIICESMLSNQRYFPIYDKNGKLTCEFVVVSNADPRCAATVIDGNERVVRARLDDAKFFYDEDLKVPMDEFVERLSQVVFQEKLGTMRQKVERMEALALAAAQQLDANEELVQKVQRSAHLAKADLVSQAVIEFTSQQGVMGGYYAEAAGESVDVVDAIREHYRPRFAGDKLPSGVVGQLVALADKIDTACGMFAIGEPPTGSADPFAVRRAAIGVIAILKILPKLELCKLIHCALSSLAAQGISFDEAEVEEEVAKFFAGRLAAMAKKDGIAPDAIDAVSAVGVIDPAEFFARTHALDEARSSQPELFDDLAVAYARAAHLADKNLGIEVDKTLLTEPESSLLQACCEGEQNVEKALASGDYEGACRSLAALREPIDRFFNDVLVMDEDTKLRENRLRLLNRFANVFADVADIGALSRKR